MWALSWRWDSSTRWQLHHTEQLCYARPSAQKLQRIYAMRTNIDAAEIYMVYAGHSVCTRYYLDDPNT
jgi:hypothetical protein